MGNGLGTVDCKMGLLENTCRSKTIRVRTLSMVLALVMLFCTSACSDQMTEINDRRELYQSDDAYRTVYEIFVYSFCDSDGDGTGDLQGVISKLDYIEDMGFDAIWLSPICPSPTYHKYDVTDYMQIDPEYGTLADYEALISACHDRNIRVYNDMVMNHTSSEHPWFIEAVEYIKSLDAGDEPDPEECIYVDYYNFTEKESGGYSRIPGTDWFYEARFWSGMPDLNLDSEYVRDEFRGIAEFWLGEGCDGFRMDAVTSYYTSDKNMSIEALGRFVSDVKSIDPDAYIVCEAWASQADYSRYYASGADSMFDFDFADADGIIAGTLRGSSTADRYVTCQVTEQELYASINPDYINAPFYTNHDMGRSAGYYTGEDADKMVKMAGALNLLMSGTAFVYYGEELGMKGSGKDENKRAPMQWSQDPESSGMCDGPSGMDSFSMKYGSYEEQVKDPNSIYNYYREAVRLRRIFPAIPRGEITEVLYSSYGNAMYLKEAEGYESVIIAINTSSVGVRLEIPEEYSDYSVLAGTLNTSSDNITLKSGILTLPGYDVAILTKEP
ncbi:MAG: alpha-amylase [Lachnospiraceae bacterium]|nr:alpha-amylase [Lachnospiraceae bacterium]